MRKAKPKAVKIDAETYKELQRMKNRSGASIIWLIRKAVWDLSFSWKEQREEQREQPNPAR